MFDLTTSFVTALGLFVGSAVVVTLGFGIGLTASPILLFVHDPQTVVILLNASAVTPLVFTTWVTRREVRLRQSLPIALAGAMGVPAGVLILGSVSDTVLRVCITSAVLALAFSIARGFTLPERVPRLLGLLVGLVVGIMVAGLSIGGPFIVLFFMSLGFSSVAVRATTAVYYLTVSLTAVATYAAMGMFTAERIGLTLAAVPVVLVGIVLGSIVVRRLNEKRFKSAVLATIVISSLVLLGQEVLTV